MSSIKCFDLLPQVHARGASPSPTWLAKSNFFPLTEKASYILLPISQSKPRVELEQFGPNWSTCSVLALVWYTPLLVSVKGCWRNLLAYLHAQTPFSEIGQVTIGGTFVQEFCYTSGNHGSICANYHSPSKTTKLAQISIGLTKRVSKNAATERTSILCER